MSGTELILTVYDKVGLSIEIPQYFEFDRSFPAFKTIINYLT